MAAKDFKVAHFISHVLDDLQILTSPMQQANTWIVGCGPMCVFHGMQFCPKRLSM